MPIQNGKYVAPIWNNNAPPAIDAVELQALSNSVAGNETAIGNIPASAYGVCDTPANNPEKTVNIANFVLKEGVIVIVKFTNGITSSSTLNVGNTGAKPILWVNLEIIDNGILKFNTCGFVYSGTSWNLVFTDRIAASGGKDSTRFGSDTWQTISEACSSGACTTRYSIGDTKTITLTTGEAVVLRIEDFDHDNLTAGGKAPMSIMMLNCLNTERRMNSTNTNVGGWGSSEMRGWMSGTLFNQLPNDLQAIIKPVDKLTSAGNQTTNIVTTSDKLWLPSYTEVNFSPNPAYSPGGEGNAYPLFINDASRVKKIGASTSSWWIRSPYVSNATSFDDVSGDGTPYIDGASYTYGVVFGFCI